MPITKLRPSFTFTEDRLRQLKATVPEAFADGEINWDALREILGEHLEDEESERFGLFWPGKRDARRLVGIPGKGTLVPVPGEGVNEDSTKNIFIEGENLEVLKLLMKSYAGRVKVIYIDPPYNTGNDFIYSDDYSEPLETYLRRSGQLDERQELLTTNSRSSGRFHSKWLSFIYPRLLAAKSLLRTDGLIFVSIDDNEVHRLRVLMDEVFGEENCIEQIVWKNKYGSGALTRGLANVHEYILCYSVGGISNVDMPLDEDDIKEYRLRDAKAEVRGGYVTQPLATTSKDSRPNLRYPIFHEGNEIWPEKQWVWSEERFEKAYENDEIVVREEDGKFSVRFKQYLRDEAGAIRRKKPISIFLGPFNQEGTQEVEDLFGGKVFDFPKPSSLIKRLFSFVVNDQPGDDEIYLDFFSGSCPAAQAVIELNLEGPGKRRFLMIQIPEPVPPGSAAKRAGYETVAEIGKERIRRILHRVQEQQAGPGGGGGEPGDLGFAVYKLAGSRFRQWQDYEGTEAREYQMGLDQMVKSPLIDGWKKEDVIIEVLLQEGFPLDSTIRLQSEYKSNAVFRVESESRGFRLWVCLDERIAEEDVERLATLPKEDAFICLDSALTDELKMRLGDAINLHVI